jgi:hypothetical protein
LEGFGGLEGLEDWAFRGRGFWVHSFEVEFRGAAGAVRPERNHTKQNTGWPTCEAPPNNNGSKGHATQGWMGSMKHVKSTCQTRNGRIPERKSNGGATTQRWSDCLVKAAG